MPCGVALVRILACFGQNAQDCETGDQNVGSVADRPRSNQIAYVIQMAFVRKRRRRSPSKRSLCESRKTGCEREMTELEALSSWNLANRSNLQEIAHLGPRAIDRMGRKFQHTSCFQRNCGNPKGAKVLLDVDDLFFLTEKYDVDRK